MPYRCNSGVKCSPGMLQVYYDMNLSPWFVCYVYVPNKSTNIQISVFVYYAY